jgi:glycerol-3-phosphate cytidylyltransferase
MTSRKIIGYTTGVFDLFHIGHLNILKLAKEHCDFLIVGVTADELVLQRKKKKAVIPFQERFEIISSIKYADQVVVEDDLDKWAAWERYRFDVIFKGDDWKGTPLWNEYEKKFAEAGVRVVYFPYTQNTSSSLIREFLVRIDQK